jgi:hypothetical protein
MFLALKKKSLLSKLNTLQKEKLRAKLFQIHVLVEEIINTKFKSFGEEKGLNTHTHTHTHTYHHP